MTLLPSIDIDQASERLVIFLPSVHAEGGGHHVQVPLNLDGLRLLYDTVVQRQRMLRTNREKVKIASQAALTQAQIEAALAGANYRREQEAKEKRRKKLMDLGLDEETLAVMEDLTLE